MSNPSLYEKNGVTPPPPPRYQIVFVFVFVWHLIFLVLQKKGRKMKVLKIDHLGIAVKSIEHGKNFWTDVLGMEFAGTETVEAQKVTTAFLPVGESEVELLESTAPDGPVAKYIDKKGEGIQHVAFRWKTLKPPWKN